MRLTKLTARIFAVVGGVLMLGAVVICLFSLDAPAQMLGMPKAAMACAEEVMQDLSRGDYTAASKLMYGQPDLGVGTPSRDAVSAMVWDAFVERFSYEFVGVCYAEGNGIFRDVSITTLDIPAMTEDLTTRAKALLAKRQAGAEDPESLYDTQGRLRADVAEQILQEAMQEALKENGQTVTRDVTLKLIHRDGQWWVSADAALLDAISGGLA